MRFAIYKGQTIHAVIDSDPGKTPPAMHAEGLRTLNGADSCVPIESDAHLAILRANATTAETIGAGVVFRGARISMSLASQVTIIGAFIARTQLAYPFRWASADDSTVIELASPADVEELFASALGLVFAARQSGNAAKAAVLEPPPQTPTLKTVIK